MKPRNLLLVLLQYHYQVVPQMHPNMISAMAASKATHYRPILMISNSDVELLYPKVNQLPVAVKFVLSTPRAIKCEFYTYFEAENCGLRKKHSSDFLNLLRIIYVPFLSNIPHVERTKILKQSRVARNQLIIYSESHNQTLRDFSHALCNVVSVSSRDINVPVDRYKKCEQRANVKASRLFVPCAASPNKFPKGRKYRAVTQPIGTSKGDIRTKPEILALMDAYRALNNTVNVTTKVGSLKEFSNKSIDMVLLPLSTAFLWHLELFPYAYYSPLRLCFFTRVQIVRRMSFIDSWKSFLQFGFTLAVASMIVALFIHTRNYTLFRGRQFLTPLPGFFLFIVSTFAGRSHAFTDAQTPIYRNLAVLSWMLSMLFLGNYVQTSITAIRILPTVSPPVKTLEELQPYMDTCAMLPCFDKDWEDVILHMTMTDHDTLFPMILKSMDICRDFYVSRGDISRCYEKTLAGTHVTFSTCNDEDVSTASEYTLSRSNSLCTFTQLAAMHALHPARYQHHRILLAIAEHGLATPHRKRVVPRVIDQDPGAQPFVQYFGLYLVGCAVSCVVLVAELLCRLKQRLRERDISRNSEP